MVLAQGFIPFCLRSLSAKMTDEQRNVKFSGAKTSPVKAAYCCQRREWQRLAASCAMLENCSAAQSKTQSNVGSRRTQHSLRLFKPRRKRSSETVGKHAS